MMEARPIRFVFHTNLRCLSFPLLFEALCLSVVVIEKLLVGGVKQG